MEEKIYDTAIIGGGPAGYTAAMYCAGSGLSVRLFEKQVPGGQMALSPDIDNYPGFYEQISGMEIGERMKKSAERFGAETVFDCVLSAELTAPVKRIVTQKGSLLARTVIIASGARPRELGLEEERGLAGKGVSYCAACDGRFFKDKTVAVAGGGNSAAEDALYLSRLCRRVFLIHRRDSLKADARCAAALEKSGVEILWNSRITEILHGRTVTGVRLENTVTGEGSELPCQGVFVAVGRVPDTSLFDGQVATDRDGYIIAGETTDTGLPGVFAAGDVRTKPFRQIITAAADGAVAAMRAGEFLSNAARR